MPTDRFVESVVEAEAIPGYSPFGKREHNCYTQIIGDEKIILYDRDEVV